MKKSKSSPREIAMAICMPLYVLSWLFILANFVYILWRYL